VFLLRCLACHPAYCGPQALLFGCSGEKLLDAAYVAAGLRFAAGFLALDFGAGFAGFFAGVLAMSCDSPLSKDIAHDWNSREKLWE
jgi:hypothetical protein